MENNDVKKIYYLYYEKMYSFEEIEKYFKGKYTYREVKKIALSKIKGNVK